MSDKLIAIMAAKKDSREQLAEALGLSVNRLSEKIYSRRNASFTQPEIATMKKRYALSETEVIDVFFTTNVS